MPKRRFTLSEAECKSLLHSFNTCKDASERIRYQAVRLYGEGYDASEVISITGCSRSSLQGWCHAYREDPSQGLADKRQGGNRAKLSQLQIEEMQNILHQYTPKERLGQNAQTATGQFWTIEDLAFLILERYGIEYKSRTSYIGLLHQCGFSYQKSEKVFKSRSQTKVADFEEQLEKN
jgi:transposase